jgi:type I restriction enzyme S subunit
MTPQQIAGELVDHYSIPAFDDGKTPSPEMGSTIRSSKFRVPNGCVLFSRLNPRIPRVWLPRSRNERRGVCSTEFLVLLPKSPVSVEYLYGIACSERFGEELASRVTGTSGSHQRVKPLDALSIPVVLPLASMIDAYSSVVRPVLQQAGRLLRENLVLAELRDAMLPRLLSGSVRSGSQLVGRVG